MTQNHFQSCTDELNPWKSMIFGIICILKIKKLMTVSLQPKIEQGDAHDKIFGTN